MPSEDDITIHRIALNARSYFANHLMDCVESLIDLGCQHFAHKTLTPIEAYGIIAQIAGIKSLLESIDDDIRKHQSLIEEDINA